jgi:23S rRNA pseudoU1915 N3-methylase RlmH
LIRPGSILVRSKKYSGLDFLHFHEVLIVFERSSKILMMASNFKSYEKRTLLIIQVLKAIDSRDWIVLLDERGRSMKSEDMARLIGKAGDR